MGGKRKRKEFPSGRGPNTGNAFSMVKIQMQESAAFRSLSSSALRLLVRVIYEASDAANKGMKKDGRPVFKLTNDQARERCGFSNDAYSRAKDELSEKGFLAWHKRGGLKGANGEASEFYLTDEWRNWTPVLKPKRDTSKARAALAEIRSSSIPSRISPKGDMADI